MKILKTDIQRALASWGFIAGIAGTTVILFFGSFDSILQIIQNGTGDGLMAGFHDQTLLTALGSNIILLCVPILAALPYTAAFLDDYKSGYLKEYLPRSGKKEYIRGKVIATGLSGGLVLFIGIVLIYVIFALVFTPMEIAPQIQDQAATNGIALSSTIKQVQQAAQPSMFPLIMRKAFVFFLSGFFWSLIGALFATVTLSRYMAYAFPFILYYVLIILCQRYFTGLYSINPQEWLNPASDWPGGTWGIILFLAELIIVTAITYATAIKRRLSDV